MTFLPNLPEQWEEHFELRLRRSLMVNNNRHKLPAVVDDTRKESRDPFDIGKPMGGINPAFRRAIDFEFWCPSANLRLCMTRAEIALAKELYRVNEPTFYRAVSKALRVFDTHEIHETADRALSGIHGIELEKNRRFTFENYLLREYRTLTGSTTLSRAQKRRRRKSINAWYNAEQFVRSLAANNATMTLESIKKINALLRPSVDGSGTFRKNRSPIKIRRYNYLTFMAPARIEGEMAKLVAWLQVELAGEEVEKSNVLVTATRAAVWLVSVHPFHDGNGRVSRLLADFILMRGGLPPAIWSGNNLFALYGAQLVAHVYDTQQHFLGRLEQVVKGVELSISILKGDATSFERIGALKSMAPGGRRNPSLLRRPNRLPANGSVQGV